MTATTWCKHCLRPIHRDEHGRLFDRDGADSCVDNASDWTHEPIGTRWLIKDWTGKVCFFGKTFGSFLEGWDFIYENDPEPDRDSPDWLSGWYDDYYVEPVR